MRLNIRKRRKTRRSIVSNFSKNKIHPYPFDHEVALTGNETKEAKSQSMSMAIRLLVAKKENVGIGRRRDSIKADLLAINGDKKLENG